MHGINPAQGMIVIEPSSGEDTIKASIIEQTLKSHGDSIAICLFSGVQYFTGQCFDIARITRWAHDVVTNTIRSSIKRCLGSICWI